MGMAPARSERELAPAHWYRWQVNKARNIDRLSIDGLCAAFSRSDLFFRKRSSMDVLE